MDTTEFGSFDDLFTAIRDQINLGKDGEAFVSEHTSETDDGRNGYDLAIGDGILRCRISADFADKLIADGVPYIDSSGRIFEQKSPEELFGGND